MIKAEDRIKKRRYREVNGAFWRGIDLTFY